MAETLTVDPTPDAEIAGESEGVQLTAEEQDSLQVGEQITEAQDQLLAGKYKDAQELEKAYIELQQKLGENGEPEEAEQAEPEQDTPSVSPQVELITQAAQEFADGGDITPETMKQFQGMTSEELVRAYMEVQRSPGSESDTSTESTSSASDISDTQVNEIKNYAGGEQAYQNIIDWAGSNLDPNSIKAFDNIINSGSVDAIKLAVNGLKSQYENANGYEGRMVTGKAPENSRDVYRSQAELVKAMSDRTYDDDPAYRQDVMAKLDRSNNLQF